MCGLVGQIIKSNSGAISLDADLMEQLIYIDALRGEDSTGVCLFDKEGKVRVIKEASYADYFLRSKEWASIRSEYVSSGKALLGHNRKSTVGKTNDENAHPFIIEDRYVFMHNGTLTSHKHLADVEIDSHALGIHLTQCEGDPKKIEEALSKVHGAYACVWLDQKKEKIYLLKNKERPLYLAHTSGGLIYASEPMFIYAAAVRNRTKVDKCDPIEDDTLYTIDVSGHGHDIKEDKLTVKKSTPHTNKQKQAGGMGQQGTEISMDAGIKKLGGEATKNSFKRFRSKAVGQRIQFWMDDYVERSYPIDDDNWLIWGQANALDIPHMIMGHINGVKKDEFLEKYEASLLTARIERCEFDAVKKMIEIYVTDVTPFSWKNVNGTKAANQETAH